VFVVLQILIARSKNNPYITKSSKFVADTPTHPPAWLKQVVEETYNFTKI